MHDVKNLCGSNFSFISGMVANANIGRRRGDVREREGEGRRSGAVQDVRVSGRLDGIRIHYYRFGGVRSDRFDIQSILRLLGAEDRGIPPVAGEQDAETALRLAVREIYEIISILQIHDKCICMCVCFLIFKLILERVSKSVYRDKFLFNEATRWSSSHVFKRGNPAVAQITVI